MVRYEQRLIVEPDFLVSTTDAWGGIKMVICPKFHRQMYELS